MIITVGKTHSGKSTFARALEKELANSITIDQDNQAEFINAYYKALLPKEGANTFKYSLTQTIVDYAVNNTDLHIILCNANRARAPRLALLEKFRNAGFSSILVNFIIPDDVLAARVASTNRSTNVFRTATSFEEVLLRQHREASTEEMASPRENEATYFLEVKDSDATISVIRKIIEIVQGV
jgi:tRNA uridine 5-carbamoylmethylation protein Kti12